jgi:hypothetical protein
MKSTDVVEDADEAEVDAGGGGGGEHDGVGGDEHVGVVAQRGGPQQRHAVEHHAQHGRQRQQHQQRHHAERHQRGRQPHAPERHHRLALARHHVQLRIPSRHVTARHLTSPLRRGRQRSNTDTTFKSGYALRPFRIREYMIRRNSSTTTTDHI